VIWEYDVVRLSEPLDGLPEGSLGTVLIIHNAGEAYEVEFVDRPGESFAIPSEKLTLAATGDWL
jgi:Domain of unknown function (DUF4926)